MSPERGPGVGVSAPQGGGGIRGEPSEEGRDGSLSLKLQAYKMLTHDLGKEEPHGGETWQTPP